MRIVIRPFGNPRREIEVTHRLTAAIAEALWAERGGNDVLNWLEAERHLARLLASGRRGGDERRGGRGSGERTPQDESRRQEAGDRLESADATDGIAVRRLFAVRLVAD